MRIDNDIGAAKQNWYTYIDWVKKKYGGSTTKSAIIHKRIAYAVKNRCVVREFKWKFRWKFIHWTQQPNNVLHNWINCVKVLLLWQCERVQLNGKKNFSESSTRKSARRCVRKRIFATKLGLLSSHKYHINFQTIFIIVFSFCWQFHFAFLLWWSAFAWNFSRKKSRSNGCDVRENVDWKKNGEKKSHFFHRSLCFNTEFCHFPFLLHHLGVPSIQSATTILNDNKLNTRVANCYFAECRFLFPVFFVWCKLWTAVCFRESLVFDAVNNIRLGFDLTIDSNVYSRAECVQLRFAW